MIKKIKWACDRLQYYWTNKKYPWRVWWLKYLLPGLLCNPFTAFKYLSALKNKEINEKIYCFHVFGKSLLKETMKVCDKVGLRPFLVYGSALGYYREGGPIATDDDIDLGLMGDDLSKMEILKQTMAKHGYEIRSGLDSEFEVSFCKKKYCNAFIDFWSHQKYKDSNVIYSASEIEGFVCIHPYPADIYEALEKVAFMGEEVYSLKRIEDYLVWTYGRQWQTPMSRQDAQLPFEEKQLIMHPNVRRIEPEEYTVNQFLDDFKVE